MNQHPMQQMADRLFRLATESQTESDCHVTAELSNRVRRWALNVAAQVSRLYASYADDGSLVARTVGAFRDQCDINAEIDDELLYELLDEVRGAVKQAIEDEIVGCEVSFLPARRAAISAIQFACEQPDTDDFFALCPIFMVVPEHAALAFAHYALADDEEKGLQLRPVSEYLAEVRANFGQRWLDELEIYLNLDLSVEDLRAIEVDPATGPSMAFVV